MLYAYQFIGMVFMTFTLISLENFQIYCMVSAATQIEIIGMRLRKLGHQRECNNEDETTIMCKQRQEQEMLDELVDCVKDHKFLMKSPFRYSFLVIVTLFDLIYRFVSDIERVFNLPFLFQLFCSSVIFCLTGFQVIVVSEIIEKSTGKKQCCFDVSSDYRSRKEVLKLPIKLKLTDKL